MTTDVEELTDTVRENGARHVQIAMLELCVAHMEDWPAQVRAEIQAVADAAVALVRAGRRA